VVETTDTRFSLTADSVGSVWTLAAGGAGAVASGGTSTGNSGSFAGSLAGSVALNTVKATTNARMYDTASRSTKADALSDVRVRATDASDIFAIAGGLSLAIANGGRARRPRSRPAWRSPVNRIISDIEALVAASDIIWNDGATGGLVIEALSKSSIQAFTVAGRASPRPSPSSRAAASPPAGAGSGSLNSIDTGHDSDPAVEHCRDAGRGDRRGEATSRRSSPAPAPWPCRSPGRPGHRGRALAIGGSFAVNNIGSADDENLVWASIDDSDVTAGGPSRSYATMLAGIFALGIGASRRGSAARGSGSAFAVSLAGSIGLNRIRNNTQAPRPQRQQPDHDVGERAAHHVVRLRRLVDQLDRWCRGRARSPSARRRPSGSPSGCR
jgi:hypothetical protein